MHKLIVVGTSAGGLQALATIVSALPEGFPVPMAVVQHRQPGADDFLVRYLNNRSRLVVTEAESGTPMKAAHVYVGPAGYHLLVERTGTLNLTVEGPVNHSIPAIDPLFESAATAFGPAVVGVVLTGANADGSRGLAQIAAYGGLTIVENPAEAEFPVMPAAALELVDANYVVPVPDIAGLLVSLTVGKLEVER